MVLLAMATYPYKLNTLSVLAVLYRVVVTVGLELGKSANIGFVLLVRQLHVDLSLASIRHALGMYQHIYYMPAPAPHASAHPSDACPRPPMFSDYR